MKIFKKSIRETPAFTAGDKTTIREVLHPAREGVELSYSLAHASLPVGAASVPHVLERSSELYIILQGNGTAYIGGQSIEAKSGDVILIPAGVEQYLENTGTVALQFWCVVDPPWDEAQEEILSRP